MNCIIVTVICLPFELDRFVAILVQYHFSAHFEDLATFEIQINEVVMMDSIQSNPKSTDQVLVQPN